MPGGRPYVLTEAAFMELRREIHSARQKITTLERHLSHVSTRRHEGGFMPPRVWIGKADAEIASDNSVGVTVSIWAGEPPNEEDTGDDLEDCFNRTSVDIASGAWCEVTAINGYFYAKPLRCS